MNTTEEEFPLPVKGMKVTPFGWGDPLLSGAFMACVKWAVSEKEVTDAFEKETGLSLTRLVGRAPITVMVDEATGFAQDLIAKWFDWVATNIWGDDESDPNESGFNEEGSEL